MEWPWCQRSDKHSWHSPPGWLTKSRVLLFLLLRSFILSSPPSLSVSLPFCLPPVISLSCDLFLPLSLSPPVLLPSSHYLIILSHVVTFLLPHHFSSIPLCCFPLFKPLLCFSRLSCFLSASLIHLFLAPSLLREECTLRSSQDPHFYQ